MAFYNQQPFFNPKVPFTGSIQGGLQEGKMITVSGRVVPRTMRFHINLQCGSMTGADVAFHFNPRFDSNPGYVVANTFQNSRWGNEERKYEAPFPHGSTFTLTFVVERDSFKVITNGKNFMQFNHRLAFSQVDTIAVDGGIEVASIAFQNPANPCVTQQGFPTYYPPPQPCAPPYAGQQAFPTMPGFPAQSFVLPYKAVINGGVYPGRSMTIQGVVSPSAKRFTINLRNAVDIALHFNPRFDEGTVVRNSHLRGGWGNEERSGGMPFHRGQPFMVNIVCEQQLFKVFLNGAQVFIFNHRYHALQEINMIEVNGDINLTSVMV